MIYTQELADQVCEHIMNGLSLRKIEAIEGMPSRLRVLRWLRENPSFQTQYAHAREEQADALAEEILDISDDGANDTYVDDEGVERTNHDVIARSRLRVDSRKWIASKLKPKKYGDKLAVGGDADAPAIRHEHKVLTAEQSEDLFIAAALKGLTEIKSVDE